MCYGSYPNPLGLRILSLNVGDEIIIKGEDNQPDVTTYIWQKDGFSALTASGDILTCHGPCFVITGNHSDEFEVSERATQIMSDINQMREDEFDLGDDPLDLL